MSSIPKKKKKNCGLKYITNMTPKGFTINEMMANDVNNFKMIQKPGDSQNLG